MTPRKTLKEGRKRLKKKGYILSDEDRTKAERLIEELQNAIAKKARSHARKTARDLKKRIAQTMPKSKLEIIWEYVLSFAVAILIALVIRHFIMEPFKIPTGSMIPTLKPGDYIVVNKARYGPRIPFTNIKPFGSYEPERWDIVIFSTRGIEKASQYPKNFVKRIVGLPGEDIEIKEGEIYVNGDLIEKPSYMKEKIIPYGVIQRDKRGWYELKDPPNQNQYGPTMSYYPLGETATVIDGRLYVGNNKVIVGKQLQGNNLPISVVDDGMTVMLKGVYYFNTPDDARSKFETWDYRINILDFHYWRKPGTGGVATKGPCAIGYNGKEFAVPEGMYLLLGDNSGRSYDSRGWGFVPYENIKGKVLCRWWPPSRWGVPK